jgi:hypothetical protein
LGFITVVIKPAVSVRGQAPINQENRTRTVLSFRVRTICRQKDTQPTGGILDADNYPPNSRYSTFIVLPSIRQINEAKWKKWKKAQSAHVFSCE